MATLEQVVESELLPQLAPLGFQVVAGEAAPHFDNASVVLEGSGLRLQILRERGVVSLDVAPAFSPNAWIDSAVLMDYLGLSQQAGIHGTDVSSALAGIGRFVHSMLSELRAVFSEHRWDTSRRELEELKQSRAERLFGG